MADKLKELFNASINFDDYVDGEATILTTDGNTSLVIKDINSITGSGLTGLTLNINGFDVGDISSSVTGSEIIGPNSVVKVKATNLPSSADKLVLSRFSSTELIEESYFVVDGAIQGSTQSVDVRASGFSLGSYLTYQYQPFYIPENPSGNVVWSIYDDGNSVQSLARHSESNRTVVVNSSYGPMSYDAINKKFYYFGNNLNTFYDYDIVAQGASNQTGISGRSWTQSSYPRQNLVGANNQYIAFSSDTDTGQVVFYEIATGHSLATLQTTNSGAARQVLTAYDDTTDTMYFAKSSNAELTVFKIESFSTKLSSSINQDVESTEVGSIYDFFTGDSVYDFRNPSTQTTPYVSIGTTVYYFKGNGGTNNGLLKSVNLATLESEPQSVIDLSSAFTNSANGSIIKKADTLANAVAAGADLSRFNSSLRITGVEST